jgi:hypothetical protein
MAIAKSQRRLGVLALMAALGMLLSALLSATLASNTANAYGSVKVNNLVVKSVTIDPQTKVATVKGAVTVTGAKRAYVGVEVVQTVGRVHTAYAYGERMIATDGSYRDHFTIKLSNEQGRLGPGDATVRSYSEAYSRNGGDYAYFDRTMQVSNGH